MPTSGGSINQSSVRCIKLVFTQFLFDDFRAGQPKATKLTHDNHIGRSSRETHAAETTDSAANQGDNGDFSLTILKLIHEFRVSQQAGIGFVQTNTSGFKGDDYCRPLFVWQIRVGLQHLVVGFTGHAHNVDEFSAMHFTYCSTDEAAFLGRHEHRFFADQAHAGNDPVIELHSLTQQRQMWTGNPVSGAG